jgi:hypothetical protein
VTLLADSIRGPFDLGDPGNLSLALVALLVGAGLSGGGAFWAMRRSIVGAAKTVPDCEVAGSEDREAPVAADETLDGTVVSPESR